MENNMGNTNSNSTTTTTTMKINIEDEKTNSNDSEVETKTTTNNNITDDNEESDSDVEYTFEVRWNDGNYYPCRILNENTNFAAGTYYNVDGYENDGTPWEAHVPVSHLRLIGSEPSTNIIKDGIKQAINERKRKIMDREEEKRKRTREALELEKRRRVEEERMRRAKEEAIARQLKQAREEKARKDKIEREEKRRQDRIEREAERKKRAEEQARIKEQRAIEQARLKEEKRIKREREREESRKQKEAMAAVIREQKAKEKAKLDAERAKKKADEAMEKERRRKALEKEREKNREKKRKALEKERRRKEKLKRKEKRRREREKRREEKKKEQEKKRAEKKKAKLQFLQAQKEFEKTAFINRPDVLDGIVEELKMFFPNEDNDDNNSSNSSSVTDTETFYQKIEFKIRRTLLDIQIKDRKDINNREFLRKFPLEDAMLLRECILIEEMNSDVNPLPNCAMCGEIDGGYYRNDRIHPDSRVHCHGCGNSYHVSCAHRYNEQYEYTNKYFCPLCSDSKLLNKYVVAGDMNGVATLLKSRCVSPFTSLLKNNYNGSKARNIEEFSPNAIVLASERGNIDMLLLLLSPFLNSLHHHDVINFMIPPSIINRRYGNFHFNALESSVSRGNVETTLQLMNYGATAQDTTSSPISNSITLRDKNLKGNVKHLDFSKGMERGSTMWESEDAKNKYNKTIMEPLGNGPVVYIKKNVVYSDVYLDLCSRTPPKACQCHDGSGKLCKPIFEEYRRSEQQCAHRKQSGAYVQCNYTCPCSSWVPGSIHQPSVGKFEDCGRRPLDQGVTTHLQIMEDGGKGFGIKILQDVEENQFICEYVGELISTKEMEKRDNVSYTWSIEANIHIDAIKYRNIAGFVNHRCKNYNLEPRKILSHQGHPRIAFVANRKIKAGEILTTNYWKGNIKSGKSTSLFDNCLCGDCNGNNDGAREDSCVSPLSVTSSTSTTTTTTTTTTANNMMDGSSGSSNSSGNRRSNGDDDSRNSDSSGIIDAYDDMRVRRNTSRVAVSKNRCERCNVHLNDLEIVNRTGSYNSYCLKCIERLNSSRQAILRKTGVIQCKDSSDSDDGFCTEDLALSEQSNEEEEEEEEEESSEEESSEESELSEQESEEGEEEDDDGGGGDDDQEEEKELEGEENMEEEVEEEHNDNEGDFSTILEEKRDENNLAEDEGDSSIDEENEEDDNNNVINLVKDDYSNDNISNDLDGGSVNDIAISGGGGGNKHDNNNVGKLSSAPSSSLLSGNLLKSSSSSSSTRKVGSRRSSRTRYETGQIVQCSWGPEWIKAKIITMLYDGRFVVRYLDGSNDERTVIREQLHDINTKAPSRYWSGKGENVAKKRISRRTSFSEGQKLYIKYDGNWHKGVIINKFFDGTFEVQYDEDLVTKRVTRDSLHPLGSPPPSIGGEIIDLSNSTSEDSSSEGSDDEEEDAEENSNGSSSSSSTKKKNGNLLTVDEVKAREVGRVQFGMDEVCEKLGAKSCVGFVYKNLKTSLVKKGKILPSGLVQSDDDDPVPTTAWLRTNFPRSFASDFKFRRCFLVNVDGKKLPNKLDLYAFRRGVSLTSNDTDEETELNDDNDGTSKTGNNFSTNGKATTEVLNSNNTRIRQNARTIRKNAFNQIFSTFCAKKYLGIEYTCINRVFEGKMNIDGQMIGVNNSLMEPTQWESKVVHSKAKYFDKYASIVSVDGRKLSSKYNILNLRRGSLTVEDCDIVKDDEDSDKELELNNNDNCSFSSTTKKRKNVYNKSHDKDGDSSGSTKRRRRKS